MIALQQAGVPQNILYVPQKYAGFRFNYQGNEIGNLGTFGMGPCVGLALHDSVTNSGMVAHFDSDATDPVHNALIVGQALYTAFTAHTDNNIQSYIVTGLGPDVSTDTIVRMLYTVCENNGLNPILANAQNGDFFLSLGMGNLFGLNIFGGPTAQNQFANFQDYVQQQPGEYEICRLQLPVVQAVAYQAP